MTKKSLTKRLLPLYFVLLAELITWGVVVVIFSPLILGDNGFVPKSYSYETRALLIGFLLSSYSVARFITSPLIGDISDNLGRKPPLILTCIGSLFALLGSGLAIRLSSISLMFVSRLLSGTFSGNMPLITASILDLSEPENKKKHLSHASIIRGIGFAIGPYLGGKLSDSAVVPWFSFDTPFWFAAGLFVIVILCLIFFFEETLVEKQNKKISLVKGLQDIWEMGKEPKLRKLMTVVFVGIFGWTLFILFVPALLFEVYHFSQSLNGDLNGYLALWIALTGLIMSKVSHLPLSNRVLLVSSLILVSIGCFGFTLPWGSWVPWVFAMVLAPGFTVFQIVYSEVASNLVSPQKQGKLFGMFASLFATVMFISPLLGGVLLSHNPRLPFIVGSVFPLAAIVLFLFFFSKGKKKGA